MDIQLYAYWQYALGSVVAVSLAATWRFWDHFLRNLFILVMGLSLIGCVVVALKRIDVGPLEHIVGQPVESFPIELVPGGFPRQLYNFRGAPIILTFFSSTCESCRAELPSYNEIAKKFKNRDIRVLTLSKESADYLSGFVKRNPMETTFGILPKDRAYPEFISNMGERPVLVVIDRNFIVREVRLDSLPLEKMEAVIAPYL